MSQPSRASEDSILACLARHFPATHPSLLLGRGDDCAVLKARSPMCGRDRIYDGTFSGTLMAGDGRLAALLRGRGVKVYTEDEIEIALLNKLGE